MLIIIILNGGWGWNCYYFIEQICTRCEWENAHSPAHKREKLARSYRTLTPLNGKWFNKLLIAQHICFDDAVSHVRSDGLENECTAKVSVFTLFGNFCKHFIFAFVGHFQSSHSLLLCAQTCWNYI